MKAESPPWWPLLGAALVLLVALRVWVFEIVRIDDWAMAPGLVPGDLVLLRKMGTPDQGDVVVYLQDRERRIGRWVATGPGAVSLDMPGGGVQEEFALQTCKGPVSAPGYRHEGTQVLRAPFVEAAISLESGQHLVLHDNRGVRTDGRTRGPVTADAMVGDVVGIVWHLDPCSNREDPP